MFQSIKEWFERVLYCHHNARALVDTQDRLSCLLDHASGGRLSYPTYDFPTMQRAVNEHHQRIYEDGWNEALGEVK